MKNKFYWIPTAIFGVFFLFSGIGALSGQQAILDSYAAIGLPSYLSTILGAAKIFGALALLIPQVPNRLKVLAYDGFLILILGGIACHILGGDPITKSIPLAVAGIVGVLGYSRWRP